MTTTIRTIMVKDEELSGKYEHYCNTKDLIKIFQDTILNNDNKSIKNTCSHFIDELNKIYYNDQIKNKETIYE